ncbi:MAG: cytochrome O ubiquinol oxidase, partial [Acidipropionibacterium jensenii]|nr:cytochrome O ubiquinol oxidase [Acidipropionibacterium jensenii]
FRGQVSFIRDNFELALILIVVISVIPMAVEWLRARRVQPVSSETGQTR